MSRGNEPAYPAIETQPRDIGHHGNYVTIADTYSTGGMTLREHYAGLAMQGLLAGGSSGQSTATLAACSVACADALIAELERVK